MQYLIEFDDEREEDILNILKDFKSVKILEIIDGKGNIRKDISESVDELIEVLAGRKEARPLSDLLNEV